MTRLDVDFAVPSRRRSNLAGLALLLVAAAALTLAALDLEDLDRQTAAAEAKLRSLTRRAGPAAGARAVVGKAVRDSAGAAVGEALARLATPWPDLLEQLEALADLPVAVLDLDAEARGRSLRLSAEARSLADMLAFVERLRQSRRFDEVFLQGHELRKVGAVEVIAFNLRATWPATRDSAASAPDPAR